MFELLMESFLTNDSLFSSIPKLLLIKLNLDLEYLLFFSKEIHFKLFEFSGLLKAVLFLLINILLLPLLLFTFFLIQLNVLFPLYLDF